MAYREVERLSGVGVLRRADGTEIGRRRYSLVVQQELSVASGKEVPALLEVSGRLDILGIERVDLVGEDLIITLIDGRSLPLVIVDESGRIAARGALE